jgi:dipeptidyl aminopeptidase/acylaminoacyl peptidase
VFFDKGLAELHAELATAFPGKKVDLQRSEGGRTLVDVWSDRLPHTYYLFDEASAKLRLVLRSRTDLGEKDLVEMRPFLLKTRDGLEIPSYYFLPANYQPGQKLPTVVHIHGGPMVRADHWAPMETVGVREAQVLASRGYAVVMPNFRVTPGFGAKIYNAGFGEVGRKLSDDHEDAARWAVQQGFADADRICISGSSYGGYASLWASIRSADVFRCAVPGLLVSDMRSQLKTSDIRQSRSGVDYWKRLLGVKGDDWTAADEVSPLRFASRSAMPLFIWAGGNDERTPLSETENMVDALKKAGKPVDTLLVKSGEAHGYGLQKNRVELYETMLKFLDRQIGSGYKPK